MYDYDAIPHDSKCESELDGQVHLQTPCGCAERREGRPNRCYCADMDQPRDWQETEECDFCKEEREMTKPLAPPAAHTPIERELQTASILCPLLMADRAAMLDALRAMVEWMDASGFSHTKAGGQGPFAYEGTEYQVVKDARAILQRIEGGGK